MKKLFLALPFLLLLNACDNIAQEEIIISQNDLNTSISKLQDIIKKKGLTLFSRIDHQANAQKVGLSLHPETVVIFGNPNVGTTLMQCNPSMGLDLPLHILVKTNEDNQTSIHYFNPLSWKIKYNIQEEKCLTILDKTAEAMQKITQAMAMP